MPATTTRWTSGVQFCLALIVVASACSGDGPTQPRPSAPPPPPAPISTGSVQVTTFTTGSPLDPNGYTVLVDNTEKIIGVNQTVTFSAVPSGNHDVGLSGVAPNCGWPVGDNPWRIHVFAGKTTETVLDITCLEPATGRLAFHSNRGGEFDIYAVNPDGTRLAQLTSSAGDDMWPVWSPDGRKVAYKRSGDIYVMNADGTGQKKLTPRAGNPLWSPDGEKVAFVTNRDGDIEIYVVNADGTGMMNLTNSSGRDEDPAWSPDGSKIAFTSSRDRVSSDPFRSDLSEIYMMNADGTGQTRLTSTATLSSNRTGLPSWSPDGTKIAFAARSSPGQTELHLINADGTEMTQLTETPDFSIDAVHESTWSPDGTKIAYRYVFMIPDVPGGTVGFGSRIYVVNADGSDLHLLSDGRSPTWSPDGRMIALAHFGDGDFEISVVNAEGTWEQRLTENSRVTDSSPSWTP